MSIRMPARSVRPQPINLGKMLLDARLASGLSQKEVARRLHMHPTTVLGWEHGYRQPHIDMIDAYLRVVGGTITLGVRPT